MIAQHPTHSRLHAMFGDVANELSAAVAAQMEAVLRDIADAAEHRRQPAFFSALEDMRQGLCADGEPWTEMALSPGRALDMARATHGLSGLSAVMTVLHASHVAREEEVQSAPLRADVVDGLFRACASLAGYTQRCLRG